MPELNRANLSESKRALLDKYLQAELTLDPARTIRTHTKPDSASSRLRSPLCPLDPPGSGEGLIFDRPLPSLFEAQVKRSPDAIAAVYEDQELTYDALNRRANQVAHYLRKLGVGPETLVGLAVQRSLDMLVGVLGILKAGGAYVPLDPAFPRERLRFMIEDAKLSVIVTEEQTAADLDLQAANVQSSSFSLPVFIKLDSDWQRIAIESDADPVSIVAPDSLAYVIYTSGSTGQPKGVAVEHRALTNFLGSMHREPRLLTEDILLSVTTLSFDISGLELYLPLICGARVIIAPRETAVDGRLLKQLLDVSEATVMQATPATWRMLIDAGWTGSEGLKVLCGGEAMSRDLANDLLARSRELWNMYGPTETTIWSSLSRIDSTAETITIGRPIANTSLYVLDENLNPLVTGETGELFIGGLGLARGYLNQPELTTERFMPDPFFNVPAARMYRTGDRAGFLPDGRVELLGRADTQIKLRGFRIELGEIEAALTSTKNVAQAVVTLREDQPGDRRLVAYVTTRDRRPISEKELRRQLQRKLPEHMVPATIVELPRLPLTPNAKIDRKALPAPDKVKGSAHHDLVQPRSQTEITVARIWKEVLKLETIGIDENFFELGGNSLLAGSMLSRIRDSFEVDLPIRQVFETPTIADLAREIDAREKDRLVPSAMRSKPLGPRQLSLPQERLWFLDQLNPGSAAFNIPLAVRLHTVPDVGVLKRSIEEIVRRHEVLRTTFPTVCGEPAPVVSFENDIELSVIDLTEHRDAEREKRACELIDKEALRPFDIATGPVLRTTLLRLDETDHIFLVTMHHIASDGWSMVLFMNELAEIYDAFSRGEPSPLAELPIQYADYAAWQRDWLEGEITQRQLSYWKHKLSGELPALDLPTDRPRPAVQTFNGARRWLTLSEAQTAAVSALCRSEGVTLFMILLAAFKVLLNRYTGQEDIIVGAPIGARPLTETENLVGFFLNNLALRTELSGNPTFRELLARVRQTALEAFANQDVPFERLIDELKPPRDLSRTPIFQVYFNLLNFVAEISVPGTQQTIPFIEAWSQSEEHFSKFDLTFYAGLHERQLKLAMVYNTDLFEEASITRMLGHFESLLGGIVASPEKVISDLSLSDKLQLVAEKASADRIGRQAEVNPTAFVPFERSEIEQSIANRFEQQVKKHPSKTAIKSNRYEWAYSELNAVANRIAKSLIRSDSQVERVALLFEHDAPMIAAMLGALKVGKTYVPLDPNYPEERLSWILAHSQAGVLLTNDRNLGLGQRLAASGARTINIDRLDSLDSKIDLPQVDPERLAYILYTSGSTGEPKGVMQNHRNVLHFTRVYTNNLRLSSEDRLTLLSSYCFDASVMDIYGALLNGATLYPIDIRSEGLTSLAEQIGDEQITIYHSTPTVYRYFVDSLGSAPTERSGTHASGVLPSKGVRTLRLIVLGGEEVHSSDVESYRKHFSDDCIFVNGLGPTEATVALQNFIDKQTFISGESVPVGFPVQDTEVLLLNEGGQSVEIQGEIALKSPHVALGYWRNSEATNAVFSVRSPTVREGAHADLDWRPRRDARAGTAPYARASDTFKDTRVYRTGDLGRRLPDGSIRFEGRKDFQIKIRGFRVELGEIESVLSQHPQVRECAVAARDCNGGNKQLIAYLTPSSNQSPSESDLRGFLKQKLPEYMLPAAFVTLEELPMTASGKVDRRALPAPVNHNRAHAKHVSPRTSLEKLLLPIWIDVLGVNIGVNDNFFECGGHSLLAVRLFAQIEKRLGHRLPLATLFQAPTVAQLAAILEKDSTHRWTSLVPIQTEGDVPPFFCVHGLGGNVLEFYDLAKHLGNQPFYALQSQGLNREQPHTSITEMAAHYIKEMREVQPHGPYFIGGRSLGGTIAFEMASQLRRQGEQIGLLALLDAYPFGFDKLLRDELPEKGPVRKASRIERHFVNLSRLRFDQKLSYLIDKLHYAPRKMKSFVWRRIYRLYHSLNRDLPRLLCDVCEFNSMAAREYVPQPYDGQVTLFWASGDLRAYDVIAGWQVLTAGGLEVIEVPGNHFNIIKEPHVAELAQKLDDCLARAQGGHLHIQKPAPDKPVVTSFTTSIAALTQIPSGRDNRKIAGLAGRNLL